MSKIKLRNAFVFEEKSSLKLMKNYMIKTMKITVFSSVYMSKDLTRDAIAVPEKAYEKAIVEGRKFAHLEGLQGVQWINYYDEAIELLTTRIACTTMSSKQRWEDVLAYVRQAKKAIGVPVWQEKFNHLDGEAFCIETLGLEHEELVQKLKKFVEVEGTGPYTEMYPLSCTGKVLDKPFVKVKK